MLKNKNWVLSLLAVTIMGTNTVLAQMTITRPGSADVQLFDSNWRFARFGLQADGSSKDEPAHPEEERFADNSWQHLDLPHDWAISGPFRVELSGNTGKLPWQGIGWYRKDFSIPATDAGKKIFIDFDGAMAYAKVWVNGQYVGEWPYGYSSFRFDITPFIKTGKQNTIAVKLDTEKYDSRWYPGAGIYRHVWLVKTNEVHVGCWGTFITTPQVTDTAAIANINVKLDNQGKAPVKAILHTVIYESADGKKPGKKIAVAKDAIVNIQADSNTVSDISVNISRPKLWSLENPHLYIAQTTLFINKRIVDTYNTVFGVRSIAFTARNGFLLNGKQVAIKGVCNHHDLGALGAAVNRSAIARQLSILKKMGCNAIRTSHNPPAPELLELADQMGFLVWDEAFDAWKTGKRKNDYNKLFPQWHERDLQAMVHRDCNHPSVIIWSVGNEVMDQRDVGITRELAEIVHREDPTRPVSNAYNDPDGGRESGAAMALDIMGVNYFFGRQAHWDADSMYKDKPTIGSETSSCVSSRGEYFFGGNYQNWQVSSYDNAFPGWGCSPDEQFRTNNKYPHLLGEFVWTGFDYLGEPTPYNSDETNLLNFRTDPAKKAQLEQALEEIKKKNPPSRSSYFGIVDLCGFPKDRYYNYQAHWRPDFPMAHILPHWNWPERKDSIVPVHVYTSGDKAELFLNGKSLGLKIKRPGQDFRLVWDSVKYVPGEVKVIAYKDGKLWATDIVKTAGKARKLRLLPEAGTIANDGETLCYVTLRVEDNDGIMVPRSHPLVQFMIEGPGEIVATDNGDATSFISFQSHERPAYNGMAQVVVKAAKGKKGKIIIRAVSSGLEEAATEVVVK
ncbi:beta-galactosidase [Chitinophaga niastensis]|uniref:Beta-galactosidase n=1 Tax=Chitinophaga niastensis TaxID=536980 RepID=A0A2P8HD45_CHINA|nr:beta-galactosidase GalB [Chitinophaga niastensis]PSL44163.1 beta-galactosidase [Chitinophaga niastensis]